MELTAIEAMMKVWIMRIVSGVEFAAALVIAVATIQALVSLVRLAWREGPEAVPGARIRIKLGQWLSLALELEVAADILLTAVAPTWDDIGRLGAIVVIRTVINYFLQRDIDETRNRQEQV